ncbi:SPOR domain-containing protein [Spirosoma sp. KUDC1026]|uniref:SPOR domain-containing protein n=1 Tax=Spirosoma sp. KUDC1026 TaxID=2745947 RepID=UPI00159BC504|nr:SPOR domain-containing protein [Spirosoma sp. KUDC1026]QKZ11572.1 SPOR domain-containing protein [Spirosoma sp. KUDC1026]
MPRYLCLGYGLLAALLTSCASSRPATTSGRSSVDYNRYTEDLSGVRPVYKPVDGPAAKPTRTTTTAPAKSTTPAPRRNEPKKTNSSTASTVPSINRELDLVLDTMATNNRSIRYASGFRIQVYVGNQRQAADDAKLLIYQNFPELSPYLTYTQPTYRLKVGDFMKRTDSERYYAAIKQLLPAAQIQPDRVDIRRSLLIK